MLFPFILHLRIGEWFLFFLFFFWKKSSEKFLEDMQPPVWKWLPFPEIIWGFPWNCHETRSLSSFTYLHWGSPNSSSKSVCGCTVELITALKHSTASAFGTRLLTVSPLSQTREMMILWALRVLLLMLNGLQSRQRLNNGKRNGSKLKYIIW